VTNAGSDLDFYHRLMTLKNYRKPSGSK